MATIDRTYPLAVPEVGDFLMRKRRVPDQVRIEADQARMLGGPVDNANLENIAMAHATLAVLTVKGPDGWDLDAMDPLDPEDTDKIWAVWRALREQEATFRKGA